MPYTFAVFLHIIGVIVMFVGLGTLTFSIFAIRRATLVGEVRAILGPLTRGRRIGFESIGLIDVVVIVGVLLAAVPGGYVAWGTDRFSAGWIRVATVTFLAIAPLGPAIVNPRVHAIARGAVGASEASLDPTLLARTHSRLLAGALNLMITMLLAIVFLMTIKPSLVGSLITVAIGLCVGLLTAPLISRSSTKPGRT